jgi:hypothetical protein
MLHWWRNRVSPLRPAPREGRALTAAEQGHLRVLGIAVSTLVGRLRLVLPVGCARDFTQTRAILLTGAAPDQVDAAIQALMARGAQCDCTVFKALGEPARCVLWHPPPGEAPPVEPPANRPQGRTT